MGNSLIKLAQRKRSNASGPTENQRKRTQKNDKNSNGIPVASHSNENQHSISPSSIFKLNGHCFDELFEYLSLKDLHSLGQTCESMQQMTGTFFTHNYSAAKFNCLRDGIYMFEILGHGGLNTKVDIDKCIPKPGFIPLITWIAIENNILDRVVDRLTTRTHYLNHIYHLDLGKFKYFKLHSDQFKSVKKLTLTNVNINRQTMGYILNILPNIEVLELESCVVTQDFYAVLLKYCKNLRRCQLLRVKFKNNYKWLLQQYEKLEHLELNMNMNTSHRIDKLRTFFDGNPNMRSFSCDSSTFLLNKDAFLNSKLKLDIFELNIIDDVDAPLCDLLYQLHGHGFYERLHLCSIDHYDFDIFPVYFNQFLKQIVLSNGRTLDPLSTHLIEYCETADLNTDDWSMPFGSSEASKNELFVESLINVERLYVYREMFDILLFIQKLRNLKKLKLCRFKSAEILQLDKLNKEREKLAGAQKVTIYVPDAVFLATKWATRNGTTNFRLIEIKRTGSYEWNRSVLFTFRGFQLPPGML